MRVVRTQRERELAGIAAGAELQRHGAAPSCDCEARQATVDVGLLAIDPFDGAVPHQMPVAVVMCKTCGALQLYHLDRLLQRQPGGE